MSDPPPCVVLMLLAAATGLFVFRNTLAEWDCRRNKRFRERLLGTRDRSDDEARPLDPLVNAGRWALKASVPDSVTYYRIKYIGMALMLVFVALFFNICGCLRP